MANIILSLESKSDPENLTIYDGTHSANGNGINGFTTEVGPSDWVTWLLAENSNIDRLIAILPDRDSQDRVFKSKALPARANDGSISGQISKASYFNGRNNSSSAYTIYYEVDNQVYFHDPKLQVKPQ